MSVFWIKKVREWMEQPVKAVLILWGIALLVRANIFQNGFVMDDYDFIVDWPLIQDWRNWPRFFVNYVPPEGQEGVYSPLKTLVHAVNYHLFGLNPLGYHWVSLGIHSLGILYVYRIVRFLAKDAPIAFWATLLFAVHPVQVEAITYMTASVDMLGIVFLLMSVYYYMRFQDCEMNISLYGWSLAWAFLAVFTHELAISLPLLIGWYHICFFQGKRKWRTLIINGWPFLFLVLSYVSCKYAVLGGITRGDYIYGQASLTAWVMIKAWMKYVLISLFPWTLTHHHQISPGIFAFDPGDFDRFAVLSQSFFEPRILLSSVGLTGIFYAAVKCWKKHRLVSFFIGWFFICLLPVSNIIPSGIYFGERYLYPGLWALTTLVAWGGMIMWRRDKIARVFGVVLLMGLSLYYGGRTWVRNQDWRDEITFYKKAAEATPTSALMWTDLGIVYHKKGYLDKALESLQKALDIRPNDPVIYFAMGNVFIDQGKNKEAMAALKEAITLNPSYGEAYYNLAGLYALSRQYDEAKKALRTSLELYRQQGRAGEARELEDSFKAFFHIFDKP